MSSIQIEELRAHLEARLPATLELLREMVGINSFTNNAEGVNQVGLMTAAAFATLGFRAETVACQNPAFGNHVILHRATPHPAPTIAFVSHLDTVFTAEEEAANDFSWREEKHGELTRIYGPGTVDIKGGTAVIYMMLETMQNVLSDLYERVNWLIFLNAAEEDFVPDFHALCQARIPADSLACLVFEGGRMEGKQTDVVVARKGMARYRLSVQGRGAHAGASHQKGANAVVQMAELVQMIAGMTNYREKLTFNVGVMRGGTVVNRVPHLAEIEVELRTFAPAVFGQAMNRIQSFEGYSSVKSVADGFACHTAVHKTHENAPWPRNPSTEHLLALWQAAGDQLGLVVRPEERGGLSDGNPLWAHVPTLDGLGPAGGNSHCAERTADGSKDQEYVVKESFVPKALLNILAVMRLIEAADCAEKARP